MVKAISEENVLDGGAGALVGLHEGHLTRRHAVAVAAEGAVVDPMMPKKSLS